MEIRSEYLWCNKFIIAAGKPLLYRNMYNAGVVYINDIVDNYGRFKNIKDVNNSFNVNLNIMQYNTLKDAVPASWRLLLKQSKPINVATEIKVKTKSIFKIFKTITNKEVYWEFINRISKRGTAMSKWEQRYDLIEFDWNEIFCNCYKVARETTLQSLQYQILHRFYPCNAILGIWYKDHSTLCEVCNVEDDLEHYFGNCTHTQIFWNSFNTWWYSVTSINLNISLFEVLFGVSNPFNEDLLDALNYCLLFAKMFISKQKKSKLDCFFYKYQVELKQRLEIEKTIYITNDKENIFDKRWKEIFEQM